MSSEERGNRSRRHKDRDRGKKDKKSKKSRSISSDSSRSRSSSRSSSAYQTRKKVKKSGSDSDSKRKSRMEEEQKPQKSYPATEDPQNFPRISKSNSYNSQPGSGRPSGKNFNPMGMYPPQKGMMNMNPMMMNMGMGMGMHPMAGMMMPPGGNMPGMRGPMGEMMDPNMWGMNSYYGQRMPGGMMPGPMHMHNPMNIKRPADPSQAMGEKKVDKPDKAKDVVKEPKKETKYLETIALPTAAHIIQSLQFSTKLAQGVLTANTVRRLLKELEARCKEKKLKTISKDIADFITEFDAKYAKEDAEQKGSHSKGQSQNSANKISELEFIEAMAQCEDLSSLLKSINLEDFPEIAADINQESIEQKFEEEDEIYEDAKYMFLGNVPKCFI
mmetsp:Transcript_80738/g.94165  ORF Transcript_80738/g.94165 Transcript_80738/m.94165 type:complete len:386 (-) Transcript_80738:162-1319(-)